ncbi:MAG: alpha/beta hydrolase [Bifidobacteriaceae bacterium]|jgi:pimeloyl-ACP methyl ester carboxylesterase|nr:alpha/beta hydrolase [Bifidobacteriaceae bacterium]
MKPVLAVSAALTLLAGLTVTGCTTDAEKPEPSPTASDKPAQSSSQPAAGWERCTAATGAECATLEVPLDWDNPEGETIELALARIPATNQAERIGSLLLNPGGPGGSGVDRLGQLASTMGAEVAARYDVVGFDPRGVGKSTAVTCYTETTQLDEFFAASWPRTPEGYEQSLAVVEPFAQACAENSGPVLAHVDTVSSAKDMDAIREFVGDAQLNFLGYSYGTLLGATYADLFPEKVGRMVLDGALDPSVKADLHEVEQAAGFEAALEAYLRDCLSGSLCPFSGTVEQAKAEIHQFLLDVEANPLPTGDADGRELTVPLAIAGIIVAMYEDDYWPLETLALLPALESGDGESLLMLSDAYFEREQGRYLSNQMEAFIAINCLDDRSPADLESAQAHAEALKQASPTLGEFWAYGEKQCAVWPYPQVGSPHVITAPGAGPILVIGTTGDPATPYHGAVALADQLESGVLLTFEGEGHTAYGRSNDCIGGAVDTYLLEGVPPADGLTC